MCKDGMQHTIQIKLGKRALVLASLCKERAVLLLWCQTVLCPF